MYHVFCTTIDTLRSVVGPLPYVVCSVNVYMKNLAHINVSLFTLSITATKFSFVCIYKSIPLMEDNFLSTVIYATSNTISILGAAAKLYLPGRPILNVVNTYIQQMYDYNSKKQNAGGSHISWFHNSWFFSSINFMNFSQIHDFEIENRKKKS